MSYGLEELKRLRELGDNKALSVNEEELKTIFTKIKNRYHNGTPTTLDNNYFTLIDTIKKIFLDAGFDLNSKKDNLTYYTIVEYELASFFKK